MPIILIIAIIFIAGSVWVLLSGKKTDLSKTNAQPDGACLTPNPVRVPGIPYFNVQKKASINIRDISTEFLAKLLGWIYIFAFVFILGCYIYGLFGVFNQKSDLQPKNGDMQSFIHSVLSNCA